MRPVSEASLAIAIPTYCRSTAVAINLGAMMEEAERLGITVYVSDDSPDTETEAVVAGFMQRHANLRYRRNIPGLGHDRNVVGTLLWPDEDYVWIMGDSFRTMPGKLAGIKDFIADQSFVFMNWQSGDLTPIPHRTGDDALALVRSLIWHQTLTGATIYSRAVVEWARRSLDHYHRNFPQLDIILGYCENHPVCIGWYGEKVLIAEKKSGSYWHSKALDVFVDDWVDVIRSHDRLVPTSLLRTTLKSHSLNTDLFNTWFLMRLREIGHLDIGSLRRPHFMDVMHISRAKVLTLMLPLPVMRLLVTVARWRHKLRKAG